ncbi:prolipoprotein diacylglyceryl transferase [Candidatus Rhodoluna planktonica]|uniref:Phosphatidylglycerol--prolipoprotein diacylglyceryl transferase n=1 Tax=Candidatus Rhodoluna planktonica TaxID=535712 RepID=A0A1D9E105_9MICO|nr:prolipoprotein diacylglyceryl transferase [Candidatus Rhodoluna planktonica]
MGPLRVHFYALFILAGIVAAVILADRRLVARGAKSGLALDIALWTVPFGVIGARIFHVLTHPNDYFFEGADLTAVFRIWEGGIAIYGGLIGGALGAFVGARAAGIKFWSFADAVAPGILLAQALGRWGNYFNQELFGLPTDLPWGLEISADNPAYPAGLPEGVLFHPTFIYESLWSLAGVAALLLLDKKFELRWGKLFGLYLVYYSFGRIWTESIRIDPSEIILGLRINIWSALLGVVVGLTIFFVQKHRHTGLEISVLTNKALEKSAKSESDGLDSKDNS